MMGNHGVGQVVRVAQDGSGHYLTVQAAIDAVPLCNTQRVVISIAAGVYRQPIYVPKTKNLITLQVKRGVDRLWGVGILVNSCQAGLGCCQKSFIVSVCVSRFWIQTAAGLCAES
jgi:pectin methylesterase-like acyl-CoA thioesterase